ncbi:ATPase, P-type (transporting), HAD superfamily, subfamily IC/heavy metal translocating P-type ATPase [Verrucomicrobium sp. GAS474]|uniref:heavy metal translocating P-type ATPase n=1 Tax=Verrucomicrobium sp. GAS474 TaxID=1882831 RepID=UPI00087CABEA|nr:heavy metal translocating P-type ATPase [Verrucomicrobium sp. GAS474]SDU18382.1 ATPase, P-type (transporting), HAD superfamily, subfamily IC/heavy metal translocating P-type ATPase [Verrucomicrobium sp. GAS474]
MKTPSEPPPASTTHAVPVAFPFSGTFSTYWGRKSTVIAVLSLGAILLHLVLRFVFHAASDTYRIPLLAALTLGGLPLLYDLLRKTLKREFGSDLLGGISIITSVILGEYLAGSIIVLMLAGGEALESYALCSASSVLSALAKRMPSIAHRKEDSGIVDVGLPSVVVGDILLIYPHDICPVDGVVIDGRGVMDESYLTGEPFQITKISGSTVISGAINGESVLTIRAAKGAADSRYAKIMEVMQESKAERPQLRRLGDRLGAIYTPTALAIALLAWFLSGEAARFLAVLVIATPCPLLIGIPIAIIGSISLCARRSIIVKSPIVLEQIAECRTAIFDKTGTLTYGEPKLTEQQIASGFEPKEVLALVAGLERYSKHPLARAILAAAKERSVQLPEASEVSEPPGQGLRGSVSGRRVQVSSRKQLILDQVPGSDQLPPVTSGLECVVAIDNRYAGVLHFRDAPRTESRSFVNHLGPKHRFARVMIVSGDRESEVRYLAKQVGIDEIYAQQSPEEKLAIVRKETAEAKTLYVGDGINDAPAMMVATVGMAIGQNSDVTAAAAGVVIMDNSLEKVDEFMHISHRMRVIALQSAVGGMALSILGMAFASMGYLSPVNGALAQEVVDVLAILNALRASFPPAVIHDI